MNEFGFKGMTNSQVKDVVEIGKKELKNRMLETNRVIMVPRWFVKNVHDNTYYDHHGSEGLVGYPSNTYTDSFIKLTLDPEVYKSVSCLVPCDAVHKNTLPIVRPKPDVQTNSQGLDILKECLTPAPKIALVSDEKVTEPQTRKLRGKRHETKAIGSGTQGGY